MNGRSKKSWKLFTLMGHQVHLTPWFLVLIAFFSFSGLQAGAGMQAFMQILIWAPTLFLGVLLHEFGHAFAIQAFGYGPSYIELQGFGGVTINRRRGMSPPGKSILISLAGPAASLALGLASWGALAAIQPAQGSFWGSLLGTMALINIVWAVFNMLPINPMDGGHVVLHGLRWILKDNRRAMRYSAISSLVFLGLGLGVVFMSEYARGGMILILVLSAMFGMQNWQIYQATKR